MWYLPDRAIEANYIRRESKKKCKAMIWVNVDQVKAEFATPPDGISNESDDLLDESDGALDEPEGALDEEAEDEKDA